MNKSVSIVFSISQLLSGKIIQIIKENIEKGVFLFS